MLTKPIDQISSYFLQMYNVQIICTLLKGDTGASVPGIAIRLWGLFFDSTQRLKVFGTNKIIILLLIKKYKELTDGILPHRMSAT